MGKSRKKKKKQYSCRANLRFTGIDESVGDDEDTTTKVPQTLNETMTVDPSISQE